MIIFLIVIDLMFLLSDSYAKNARPEDWSKLLPKNDRIERLVPIVLLYTLTIILFHVSFSIFF